MKYLYVYISRLPPGSNIPSRQLIINYMNDYNDNNNDNYY